MAQQTRHGLYGGARGLYGSFSGKVETVEAAGIFLGTYVLKKVMPTSTTLKKAMPADTTLEAQ